ncbi:delta-1-pyrroline-5-carboxylate dehydrogenase [Fusarium proliferatum]|nr:delta-1-pyrroline-5-carboxylate dehydrogenase [Fusarium proliferatum]
MASRMMLNARQAIRRQAVPRQVTIRCLGTFRIPPIRNEPNPTYTKGSLERQKLQEALDSLKQRLPIKVPLKISGQKELMVNYGLRFNVHYAAELYKQQNTMNDAGVWNKMEYRPLEGFVYAISPFNFTAIGANLTAAPAIMGNVVIWKPSDSAIYADYVLQKVLEEAGLPDGVIQFLPGDAEKVTKAVLDHPKFGALHFTGSTDVFRDLYGKIGDGIRSGLYESYPRVIGETGGKSFHLVHNSADIRNAVVNTVRGAFEYQGQECSATSRLYIPESIWPKFKDELIAETEKLQDTKTDKEIELLAGGSTDKSKGWFIQPTIFQTNNPSYSLMKNELFGSILSVYVYPDAEYKHTMELIDRSTKFALTGAVFSRDRTAIAEVERALRQSAGNLYVNCKSSGAVVGHQPFGGDRTSVTNDKATSTNLLSRFTSIRSMKEGLVGADEVEYPSNEV